MMERNSLLWNVQKNTAHYHNKMIVFYEMSNTGHYHILNAVVKLQLIVYIIGAIIND